MTHQAEQMVNQQGNTKSPATMLVVMLALLSCQVSNVLGEAYWTYFPDPPLVRPAVWTGESIPIFANDTHMMGGFPYVHITPVYSVGFNYTGYTGSLPICWDNTSCLKSGPKR